MVGAGSAKHLFSHDLHNDFPLSGSGVEVNEHDLLPCAKHWMAITNGYTQRRTHERSPHVGMPVVIVPRLFVEIASVFRGDTLKGGLQIAIDQSGFKFGGCDARGGADDKDSGDAPGDLSDLNTANHLFGKVDDLVVPTGANFDLMRFDHHHGG